MHVVSTEGQPSLDAEIFKQYYGTPVRTQHSVEHQYSVRALSVILQSVILH